MVVQYPVYRDEPFKDHLKRLRWRQGEHMLICAPTSGGKTTLFSYLQEKRSHVVMVVTKPSDPTFARQFAGWERITRWPKGGLRNYQNHVLLWPTTTKDMRDNPAHQREVIYEAINAIWKQGKRCLAIDEGLYFCDSKYLGMSRELGQLHYTARSSGLSLVTLTQRPVNIEKIVFSSVTHAYIGRTKDADDARKLADLSTDVKELMYNAGRLKDRHDYVYVNPQGDARPAIINTAR